MSDPAGSAIIPSRYKDLERLGRADGVTDKIMRTLAAVSVGWVLQAFGYIANAER